MGAEPVRQTKSPPARTEGLGFGVFAQTLARYPLRPLMWRSGLCIRTGRSMWSKLIMRDL